MKLIHVTLVFRLKTRVEIRFVIFGEKNDINSSGDQIVSGILERIRNEFIYPRIIVFYFNDSIVGVCNVDPLGELFVMNYKMFLPVTILIFYGRVCSKKKAFP